MSDPPAVIEGEVLPQDILVVPDEVIADLQAAFDAAGENDPAKESAVRRLQLALGTREQSVKARLRRDAIIAMKSSGISNRKIADMLGVKENSVKVAVWRARQSGHLNDLRQMLEHDVSALAVDTITHHLKKKDKDVAIEHLKGVGLYKNHSNQKFEGGGSGFQMPPLQVNVVVQNAVGVPSIVTPDNFSVSEGAVGLAREDE